MRQVEPPRKVENATWDSCTSRRMIAVSPFLWMLSGFPMTLAVCLLTRNEADKLDRVLGSVAGVADELIVADTGSTDATVEKAQALGARVVSATWDDDFSHGRNQALDQVTSEWILWLNPDEELDPASRPVLKACMNQAQTLAWFVRVHELSRADSGAFTETVQPRLFRNRCGVRYRGRLHPGFETPLEELAVRHGLSLGVSEARIRHHAYLSKLTADKLRWAVRLLEKELDDRPGQVHFMIELGRTLLLLNDARGHQVLAEAATQVLRSLDAPAAPTPTVGSLLEYVLTSPGGDKNPITRTQAHELARRWFAATPPVVWAAAASEFHAGRVAEAIPLLERLIQLGQTGQYDRSAAFEPHIIGGLAWQNLGICYAKLEDWGRAELCFGKLLTLPEFKTNGMQHYAWVQQQKQKAPPAR